MRAEDALAKDSQEWTETIEAKIAECRAQQLPTPEARSECIEPEQTIDRDIVAPATVAVVAALRAYWLAAANDASPVEFARLLDDLRVAVSDLPPEIFDDLRKAVQ